MRVAKYTPLTSGFIDEPSLLVYTFSYISFLIANVSLVLTLIISASFSAITDKI
jgi:hypothetical protein